MLFSAGGRPAGLPGYGRYPRKSGTGLGTSGEENCDGSGDGWTANSPKAAAPFRPNPCARLTQAAVSGFIFLSMPGTQRFRQFPYGREAGMGRAVYGSDAMHGSAKSVPASDS